MGSGIGIGGILEIASTNKSKGEEGGSVEEVFRSSKGTSASSLSVSDEGEETKVWVLGLWRRRLGGNKKIKGWSSSEEWDKAGEWSSALDGEVVVEEASILGTEGSGSADSSSESSIWIVIRGSPGSSTIRVDTLDISSGTCVQSV